MTKRNATFLGISWLFCGKMQAWHVGLKQLYGGNLCESECDHVCELMNFSLVHAREDTLTWSARP